MFDCLDILDSLLNFQTACLFLHIFTSAIDFTELCMILFPTKILICIQSIYFVIFCCDRQMRILKQQLREKDELVTAVQKPDESFQGKSQCQLSDSWTFKVEKDIQINFHSYFKSTKEQFCIHLFLFCVKHAVTDRS